MYLNYFLKTCYNVSESIIDRRCILWRKTGGIRADVVMH